MARPSLQISKLRATALYQEMLDNHRLAAASEERARRLVLVGSILSFFFWTAVVVAFTSWGMHTVRYAAYSQTIIEAGLLLGGAGIICTALFAANRLG
jgi:hypothetical protein